MSAVCECAEHLRYLTLKARALRQGMTAPESSLHCALQARAAGVCTTSPACLAAPRAAAARSLHSCSLRALRRHGPAHSLLAQTARVMAAGRLRVGGCRALHVSAAAAVEAKEETFTYQAEARARRRPRPHAPLFSRLAGAARRRRRRALRVGGVRAGPGGGGRAGRGRAGGQAHGPHRQQPVQQPRGVPARAGQQRERRAGQAALPGADRPGRHGRRRRARDPHQGRPRRQDHHHRVRRQSKRSRCAPAAHPLCRLPPARPAKTVHMRAGLRAGPRVVVRPANPLHLGLRAGARAGGRQGHGRRHDQGGPAQQPGHHRALRHGQVCRGARPPVQHPLHTRQQAFLAPPAGSPQPNARRRVHRGAGRAARRRSRRARATPT